MGRGVTGGAATHLVPGMGVVSWLGVVDPPTASTRADIGSWKRSCDVEKVLQRRGTM